MEGNFTTESLREDGQRFIYRTDDKADFILHSVELICKDHGVASTVTVRPDRSDWFVVQIRLSCDAESDECSDVSSHLLSILGIGNKGGYDCRGESISEDGLGYTFEVRLIGSPVM